jgi:hypothetical protein
MSKPRKEQVKNLKTKYTRLQLSFPQSANLGEGTSNEFVNAGFDGFVNALITKSVGGCESDSPAVLYGGVGAFTNVFVNDQFSVTVNGVNSGLPTVITISIGDIVNFLTNSNPVVTTTHLASKINSSVGFELASNVDGRIILSTRLASTIVDQKYATGDEAGVTLNGITPFILSNLGFSSNSSISASGTSTPTRGIITQSSDGTGGFVKVHEKPPLSWAVTQHGRSYLTSFGDGSFTSGAACEYVPSRAGSAPVFARITSSTNQLSGDRKLKVSYFQTGKKKLSKITSNSDFRSLTSGESIDVEFTRGPGETVTKTIALSAPPSGQNPAQWFADQLNTAFSDVSFTGRTNFIPPSLCVTPICSSFPTQYKGGNFYINLNGTSPIEISLQTEDLISPLALVTKLNILIGAAGQAGQGQAFLFDGDSDIQTVCLKSLASPPSSGSITIIPGDPNALHSDDGTFLLTTLGITPGHYAAWGFARLYGNDEVLIEYPSQIGGPYASLTISGSPTVLQKIGVGDGLFNIESGDVPVDVGQVTLYIPEMVEFDEELDSHDSIEEEISTELDPNPADPLNGIGNFGFSNLLDMLGKIPSGLLPSVFQQLKIKSLSVGSGSKNEYEASTVPSIEANHESVGLNGFEVPDLLFEGKTSDPSDAVLRVYLVKDRIYISSNATAIVGFSETEWASTGPASVIEIKGNLSIAHYVTPVSILSPALLGSMSWPKRVELSSGASSVPGGESGPGLEIQNIGQSSSTAQPYHYVPMHRNVMTGHSLVEEEVQNPGWSAGLSVRKYAGAGEYFIAFNAKQTAPLGKWVKETNGEVAYALRVSYDDGVVEFLIKDSADNVAWNKVGIGASGWSRSVFSISLSTFLASFTNETQFQKEITSVIDSSIVNPVLLYQSKSSPTEKQYRMYRTPTGSAIVWGAHWDTATSLWKYDVASPAIRVNLSDFGFSVYQRVDTNNWNEVSWTRTFSLPLSGTAGNATFTDTVISNGLTSDPDASHLVNRKWVESNWALPGVYNAIHNSDFYFKNRVTDSAIRPNVLGTYRAWVADRWHVINSPQNVAYFGDSVLSIEDYSAVPSSVYIIQEIDREYVKQLRGKTLELSAHYTRNMTTTKTISINVISSTGSSTDTLRSNNGNYNDPSNTLQAWVNFGSDTNQTLKSGSFTVPDLCTCLAIRIDYPKGATLETGQVHNIHWITLKQYSGVKEHQLAAGSHELERKLLDAYYYNTNSASDARLGLQTLPAISGETTGSLPAFWFSPGTLLHAAYMTIKGMKRDPVVQVINGVATKIQFTSSSVTSIDNVNIYTINATTHVLYRFAGASVFVNAGDSILWNYEVDAEL